MKTIDIEQLNAVIGGANWGQVASAAGQGFSGNYRQTAESWYSKFPSAVVAAGAGVVSGAKGAWQAGRAELQRQNSGQQ